MSTSRASPSNRSPLTTGTIRSLRARTWKYTNSETVASGGTVSTSVDRIDVSGSSKRRSR